MRASVKAAAVAIMAAAAALLFFYNILPDTVYYSERYSYVKANGDFDSIEINYTLKHVDYDKIEIGDVTIWYVSDTWYTTHSLATITIPDEFQSMKANTYRNISIAVQMGALTETISHIELEYENKTVLVLEALVFFANDIIKLRPIRGFNVMASAVISFTMAMILFIMLLPELEDAEREKEQRRHDELMKREFKSV